MKQDRRTFLKSTSGAAALAGAAAFGGASITSRRAAAAPAALLSGTGELREFPKGFTFATLRRADGGYGLGIKMKGGVFDVMGAEQEYRQGAPTTIEAMLRGQGDIGAFYRLIDRAG